MSRFLKLLYSLLVSKLVQVYFIYLILFIKAFKNILNVYIKEFGIKLRVVLGLLEINLIICVYQHC